MKYKDLVIPDNLFDVDARFTMKFNKSWCYMRAPSGINRNERFLPCEGGAGCQKCLLCIDYKHTFIKYISNINFGDKQYPKIGKMKFTKE